MTDNPMQFGQDVIALLGGIQSKVAAIDATTKSTGDTVRVIEGRVGALEQIQARHEGEVKARLCDLHDIAHKASERIATVELTLAETKGRDGLLSAIAKSPFIAWVIAVLAVSFDFIKRELLR